MEAKEGEFEFRMAGRGVKAVGAERPGDVLDRTQGREQEPRVTPSMRQCEPGFHEMADAVELVLPLDVREPPLDRMGRVPGVQVAVRRLGRADPSDPVVHPGLQVGIRPPGQGMGRSLEDLVDVGVVVEAALVGVAAPARGPVEVPKPPRLLAAIHAVGERCRVHDIDPAGPESVPDLDVPGGYGAERRHGGEDRTVGPSVNRPPRILLRSGGPILRPPPGLFCAPHSPLGEGSPNDRARRA